MSHLKQNFIKQQPTTVSSHYQFFARKHSILDTLIIPLNFIYLSCHEKAHDSKESSRENSKPHHESQNMLRQILGYKLKFPE